ncbi:hypothetical protein A2W24_04995 [Microgenomates group bacterium RBG_16_45_19]|nr:MAG: hypothetical protein A2W24_04995 [Microgenomates group bacterium RBG_16_45_19]
MCNYAVNLMYKRLLTAELLNPNVNLDSMMTLFAHGLLRGDSLKEACGRYYGNQIYFDWLNSLYAAVGTCQEDVTAIPTGLSEPTVASPWDGVACDPQQSPPPDKNCVCVGDNPVQAWQDVCVLNDW